MSTFFLLIYLITKRSASAEAMSSITAIGLLGKLFQILSMQPCHEICYDDTSAWTEEKSYTSAVSKRYIHSIQWLCFSTQLMLNALVEI